MIKVIFRHTHLMTTQRHLGKGTDTEAIRWMTASTRIAAEGEVRKAPPGFLCYLKDMQVLRAGVALRRHGGFQRMPRSCPFRRTSAIT